MSNELDFKHSITFKKATLKRSGKRAKKKVYKAAGESKIDNADRNRKLTDNKVIFLRSYGKEGVCISEIARYMGISRQTITRALKGETFKHLNAIVKPWK
jgi:DNA-binding transcriptional ArsR family regulator